MKGRGEKHERETVIRFSEGESMAIIWTASEGVYRRLLKLGYTPTEDGQRHACFEMPKTEIRLPRPRRQVSDKQRAALQKATLASKAPARAAAGGPNATDPIPTGE